MRAALQHCTGLDDEAFAEALEETRLESHHGGEVVLLEATLTRAKDIRGALGLLGDAEREELSCAVEPRTDDQGVFTFRLSKQEAFEGNIRLTAGDDAVQLRLKPEVHPSSREAAMAAISSWFSDAD